MTINELSLFKCQGDGTVRQTYPMGWPKSCGPSMALMADSNLAEGVGLGFP